MAKSELRRIHGIFYLTPQHKTIKRLKREHPAEIHGTKHWGSSFLLMQYFKRHPPKKGARVLELGAGWGLISAYLARKHKCKVTALDADENVFPYLDVHAEMNEVKIDTLCKPFEKLSKKELDKFDLIVGGDICFWDSLSDILFKLIRKANSGKRKKKIIIADPERPPFWDLVDRCMDKIDADMEVVEQTTNKPRRLVGQLLVIDT